MSKVFQCTLCEEKFSIQDMKSIKFFPSTMVCSSCYDEAEKDKSVCFAKAKQYDKTLLVCSKICPDRKVCRLYLRLQRNEI